MGRIVTSDRGITIPMIVAIGASAGGVDAISRLLSGLPPNLAATVLVVLHRPIERASHLREILSLKTSLAVRVAQDGDRLESGVCLIGTPDRHMAIGPDLRVINWSNSFYRSHNIDVLFNSLAMYAGERTIGVILSGLLKDGVLGLRAIKQAGGTIFVQRPEDAAYPELPGHAIRYAGPVDLVDTAGGLAKAVGRLVGHHSSA